MNTIKKAKAPPALGEAVTFQQLVHLALEIAHERLQQLIAIYQEDGAYDQDVVDIDYAVRVGVERLDRMRQRTFADYSEFDAEWFGIAAILKMSLKVLVDHDSFYGRSLKGAWTFFDQMRNTIEYVDVKGRLARA